MRKKEVSSWKNCSLSLRCVYKMNMRTIAPRAEATRRQRQLSRMPRARINQAKNFAPQDWWPGINFCRVFFCVCQSPAFSHIVRANARTKMYREMCAKVYIIHGGALSCKFMRRIVNFESALQTFSYRATCAPERDMPLLQQHPVRALSLCGWFPF